MPRLITWGLAFLFTSLLSFDQAWSTRDLKCLKEDQRAFLLAEADFIALIFDRFRDAGFFLLTVLFLTALRVVLFTLRFAMGASSGDSRRLSLS